MQVVTDKNILHQVSKEFTGTKEEYTKLIQKLENVLSNYPGGVGLSGIQINIPIKVAIIRTRNLTLNLYNPIILDKGPLFKFNKEGCLSIPNVFQDTLRHQTITIKNGDGEIIKLKGFESVAVQHEIDHFYGILFIDRPIINNQGEI